MTGNEFVEAMDRLSPLAEDAPPHTWPRHRLSLRQHARGDTPHLFLQWSTIVATMFVGDSAGFTNDEYHALEQRYRDILQEPYFGGPKLMKAGQTVTSGNLIHQAYHLMQLEQHLGIEVQDLKSVVEFGGGYGLMAVLFRRLGFTGKYTIIDLPELSLIQEYYLSNTIGLDNIYLIDNYDGRRMHTDLFLAIYSISEVPPPYRETLLKKIQAQYHFIAHQDLYTLPDGEQINNVEYFEALSKRLKLRHWENEALDGHWYMG